MNFALLPWGRIASYAVLVAIIAFLYFRATALNAERLRWQERAGIEAANHRATKANFRATQAQAHHAAEQARLAHEAKSIELARRIDNDQEHIAARAAADRFAQSRRVQDGFGSAVGGAPGEARAAGQADAATSGDRAGAEAVVLTRPEFDALIGNTLRLDRVQRWGQSLIAEGLAVADSNPIEPE